MIWLLGNWRLIAVLAVVAGLGGAALWYRGDAADARAELAEYRRAYDVLAASAQRQAAAMEEVEQKAAQAAEKGRRARQEAAGAVAAAKHSADALARLMAAPRPTGECPVQAAVEAVRADLAGR